MYNKRFLTFTVLIWLACLLPLSAPAAMGEPPEQPYRFQAQVADHNTLLLTWEITPGTYLYQEKIGISLAQAGDVTLGEIALPRPTIKKNTPRADGSIGDVAVYYDKLELQVPLIRTTQEAREIKLKVVYQGCADQGICYPPERKSITLSLPAAGQAIQPVGTATLEGIADTPQQQLSEQDRIAAILANENAFVALLFFVGFGLLLALTPCVFPMIPILSGIIVGQGESITPSRGFFLSLIYVLAMASTYALAGVVAGLLGHNIQADLQSPWLLATFALIFVLLALSMFGFYELQLPTRWQSRLTEISNRQQGGTLLGVAIMGFLSALIIGPCVAPPFAGGLIYIANTGDAVLGGSAFFALGIGMGLPLLVIGASAGKLLPRAGAWMDSVKSVFGALFLAVAILLLERILPAAVSLALWGTLLIVSAIYMGALRELPVEASGWSRLWKGLGVVLMIYGGLMLVGAAAGGKDTLQPLRGVNLLGAEAEASRHTIFQRIKSVADLERELATAKAAKRPVMIDFYADWCNSCKQLERYTFSDPAVIKALDGFVLLQADVTARDDTDKALQNRFGVTAPPAIVFFNSEGKEQRELRLVGFAAADYFVAHLQRVN
jgi:thiol:disulfide interchange protein DsbD